MVFRGEVLNDNGGIANSPVIGKFDQEIGSDLLVGEIVCVGVVIVRPFLLERDDSVGFACDHRDNCEGVVTVVVTIAVISVAIVAIISSIEIVVIVAIRSVSISST